MSEPLAGARVHAETKHINESVPQLFSLARPSEFDLSLLRAFSQNMNPQRSRVQRSAYDAHVRQKAQSNFPCSECHSEQNPPHAAQIYHGRLKDRSVQQAPLIQDHPTYPWPPSQYRNPNDPDSPVYYMDGPTFRDLMRPTPIHCTQLAPPSSDLMAAADQWASAVQEDRSIAELVQRNRDMIFEYRARKLKELANSRVKSKGKAPARPKASNCSKKKRLSSTAVA
ncbi:hypothetical protein V5O48_016241 [Marasmius crinis-equi]|uniref:Uncharacterized protein n=1 Tax=Marasmius crinis-equi TaxID=585013 RepID=A0ABR3ES83_9AGAR